MKEAWVVSTIERRFFGEGGGRKAGFEFDEKVLDFELYFESGRGWKRGKRMGERDKSGDYSGYEKEYPVAINTGKRTLLLLHSSHCGASFQSVCHRDAASSLLLLSLSNVEIDFSIGNLNFSSLFYF